MLPPRVARVVAVGLIALTIGLTLGALLQTPPAPRALQFAATPWDEIPQTPSLAFAPEGQTLLFWNGMVYPQVTPTVAALNLTGGGVGASVVLSESAMSTYGAAPVRGLVESGDRLYAVWARSNGSPWFGEPAVSVSRDGGRTFDPEILGPSGPLLWLAPAASDDGGLELVWVVGNVSVPETLSITRIAVGQGAFGPNQVLASGNVSWPSVAVDGNETLVAWDAHPNKIGVRRSQDGGVSFGDALWIPLPPTSFIGRVEILASRPYVYLLWLGCEGTGPICDYRLRLAVSYDEGQTYGEGTVLASGPALCCSSEDMAFGRDGKLYVAWGYDTSGPYGLGGWGIQVARFSLNGTASPLALVAPLNPVGRLWSLSIAADLDGHPILAYNEEDTSNFPAYRFRVSVVTDSVLVPGPLPPMFWVAAGGAGGSAVLAAVLMAADVMRTRRRSGDGTR